MFPAAFLLWPHADCHGKEGGQAGGDVRNVAVGVGQVRMADEVGAPAGQGVAEDPLAER